MSVLRQVARRGWNEILENYHLKIEHPHIGLTWGFPNKSVFPFSYHYISMNFSDSLRGHVCIFLLVGLHRANAGFLELGGFTY